MKKYASVFIKTIVFSLILSLFTLIIMVISDNDEHLVFLSNFIVHLKLHGLLLVLSFIVYNVFLYYFLFIKDRKELRDLQLFRQNVDSLINETPIAFFYVNKEGNVYGNRYSLSTHENIKNIIDKKVRNFEINKYINDCFLNQIPISTSIKSIDNGSEKFYSLSCNPILKGKLVDNVSCILIDITEQKNIMKILRESESKFADFANIIPEMIVEVDLQGFIIYRNEVASRIIKAEKNILNILATEKDLLTAKTAFSAYTLDNDLKSYGSSNEYKIIDNNNDIRTFSVSSSARLNEYGNKTIILIATDITELKDDIEFETILKNLANLDTSLEKTREILKISFREISNFFGLNNVLLYRIDSLSDEKIIYNYYSDSKLNNDYVKYLYSICIRKESLLLTKDSFISDKLKESLFVKMNICGLLSFRIKITENISYLFVVYNLNIGKNFDEKISSKIKLYTDILRNILSEIEYNIIIKEKSETLDVLIDNSILGILSISDKKITYINRKLCSILEIEKEDYMEKNVDDFFEVFPDLKTAENQFRKLVKRGADEYKETISIGKKNIFIEIRPVTFDKNNSLLFIMLDKQDINDE